MLVMVLAVACGDPFAGIGHRGARRPVRCRRRPDEVHGCRARLRRQPLEPIWLRSFSLPFTLTVGLKGSLSLTAGHAVATFAAGAFGFLAVFALREGLSAVLGHSRFRAISAPLQALLTTWAAIPLLALLAGFGVLVITGTPLPPLWFVGLHETMAGPVIDNLPRREQGWLGPLLRVPELLATNLYRSLWPEYHRLGRIALVMLAIVTAVTIVSCAWNNRRLPAPVVHRRGGARRVRSASRWIVARVLAPSSLQQAGFWFTMQTIPRRATHRAVLASAVAIGVSLMVVTVRGEVLAAQTLLLAAVLTGFRRAVELPAELRASSTFSLAWSGDVAPYLSGVKRAGYVGLDTRLLLSRAVTTNGITGGFSFEIAPLHWRGVAIPS